mgnify:CR=1 FL=1
MRSQRSQHHSQKVCVEMLVQISILIVTDLWLECGQLFEHLVLQCRISLQTCANSWHQRARQTSQRLKERVIIAIGSDVQFHCFWIVKTMFCTTSPHTRPPQRSMCTNVPPKKTLILHRKINVSRTADIRRHRSATMSATCIKVFGEAVGAGSLHTSARKC